MLAVPHGLDLVNINLAKKIIKIIKIQIKERLCQTAKVHLKEMFFFFPSLWYQDSSITLRMKKFYN